MTRAEGPARTTFRYRVPFFDTDAMGVVHHANYIRYLELARVQFLDEHDVPYKTYIERGLQVAVTRVDVSFKRPARFDDTVAIDCRLSWVKGASLGFVYELRIGSEVAGTGLTEHAVIDARGRPTRMPKERRDRMRALLAGD